MLASRKREQLTCERFTAFGGALQGFDGPRQLRIEQAFEQLRAAADDHQQIVEIVRDAAGQFPDRLHFMPALLHSQFQRAVRYAGAPLVGPVKDAEMFADDLLRRVTDYFLGGTVPARHMARRIKDKDRVVGNALEKDLKAAFGAIEDGLRLLEIKLCTAQLRQQMRLSVAVYGDDGA